MLKSDKKSDIFLGGKMLLHSVPFITTFSIEAGNALKGPQEYQMIKSSDMPDKLSIE